MMPFKSVCSWRQTRALSFFYFSAFANSKRIHSDEGETFLVLLFSLFHYYFNDSDEAVTFFVLPFFLFQCYFNDSDEAETFFILLFFSVSVLLQC